MLRGISQLQVCELPPVPCKLPFAANGVLSPSLINYPCIKRIPTYLPVIAIYYTLGIQRVKGIPAVFTFTLSAWTVR